MAKGNATKNIVDRRVTWAQAFRDIFVGAMNKGQLIPVVLGLCMIIWMWRADPHDLAVLGERFLNLVQRHEGFGYVLWVITLVGWILHAKFVRGTTDAESGRIGKEKTALQERLAGKSLPSSRR